jgi:uncharacterized protein YcgL (UPF0745 family)
VLADGDIMRCFVYRSRRKRDAYLYLRTKDEFSRLPVGLMAVFGQPEFALEFDLTPGRRLASVDARQVLKNLEAQGYYLQMPSENELPA